MTKEIRDTLTKHYQQERENYKALMSKELKLEDGEDLPVYTHQEYPKWLHREGDAPVLVHSAEAEAAHKSKKK